MSSCGLDRLFVSSIGMSGVFAYVEPRCNITKDVQIYAGLWGWSTKLPTQPTGEFDLSGGIRPTFGPVQFDFGFMYYWYPRETQQWFGNAALTTLKETHRHPTPLYEGNVRDGFRRFGADEWDAVSDRFGVAKPAPEEVAE
jgi:hypothetical protein